MNPERSVKEIVTLVVAQMEDWISYGFSPLDTSRILAKLTGADASKLMDIWLDNKIRQQRDGQLEFDFNG